MADSFQFFQDDEKLLAPSINELDKYNTISGKLRSGQSKLFDEMLGNPKEENAHLLAPSKEELFKVQMLSQSLSKKKEIIFPLKEKPKKKKKKPVKYMIVAAAAMIAAILYFDNVGTLGKIQAEKKNKDQLAVIIEEPKKIEPEKIRPTKLKSIDETIKENVVPKDIDKQDVKISKSKSEKIKNEKAKSNDNKIVKNDEKKEQKKKLESEEKLVKKEKTTPVKEKIVIENPVDKSIDLTPEILDLKKQLAEKLPEKTALEKSYSSKVAKINKDKKAPSMSHLIHIEKNSRPISDENSDDDVNIYLSSSFKKRMRSVARLDRLTNSRKVSLDNPGTLNLKSKKSQNNRDYLLLMCYKIAQWKSLKNSGSSIPEPLKHQLKLLALKFGFNADINDPYDVQVSLKNIFGADASTYILIGNVLHRLKKPTRMSTGTIKLTIQEIKQLEMTASSREQAFVDFLVPVKKQLSKTLGSNSKERNKLLLVLEKQIAGTYK